MVTIKRNIPRAVWEREWEMKKDISFFKWAQAYLRRRGFPFPTGKEESVTAYINENGDWVHVYQKEV